MIRWSRGRCEADQCSVGVRKPDVVDPTQKVGKAQEVQAGCRPRAGLPEPVLFDPQPDST